MTETSVVTHLGKSRSPKPDLSIIFNKIEAIEREIRELRRVPALSRNQTRLDEARLSPVQEEALRTLSESGGMTAEEVAIAVDRTRPLMVINLNQLVALGLLDRERRGKRVYFKLKPSEFPSPSTQGPKGSGCYMFAVLVSDEPSENTKKTKELFCEQFKGLPNWRIEHVAVIPKGAD